MRFSTIKDRFPIAHIEKSYGSAKENRDYILKTGKWTESDKTETTVEGTFYEYGELPPERAEKNPMSYMLIQDLHNGKPIADIVEDTPDLAFKVKEIETLRQTLLSKKQDYRHVEVTYIFGSSGTGKTRSIYEKHSPYDICRVTNYRNGRNIYFDDYRRTRRACI
jgi:hypothetical protein